MTEASVISAVLDRVATITLNRPGQLNAVNEEARLALLRALTESEQDAGVAAVVLTGAGRGFCVGQDLAATEELADCHDCVGRTYNPIVEYVAAMSKPVVAAVNGPAVGAGMGFALACDMVLMADGSFFSCAFGKVGLVPDSGATYFLAKALGHRRAFEIAATGRKILPEEAVALGLANRVVGLDVLLDEARILATSLASVSPKALQLTKRLLRQASDATLEQALTAEALGQGVCGATREHIDLRTAFLKR